MVDVEFKCARLPLLRNSATANLGISKVYENKTSIFTVRVGVVVTMTFLGVRSSKRTSFAWTGVSISITDSITLWRVA